MTNLYNKALYAILAASMATVASAQRRHVTADSLHEHIEEVMLQEIEVTGVAGTQCLKEASAPFTVLTHADLGNASAANIIDAVANQPGLAQISTGAGISKPVIRGLGYNRVLVVDDGIRQEGQQWGDEHGIEIDANKVWSVEVLKGPASLMYGSDALAGVMILHPAPLPSAGEFSGKVSAEYNTNNGLQNYSANVAGNVQLFKNANKGNATQAGNDNGRNTDFVYDLRASWQQAHAYTNKYDGRVPGSQYKGGALSSLLGLTYNRGHNLFRISAVGFRPSIVEGERDAADGQLEWPDNTSHRTYSLIAPYQHVTHIKAVADNQYEFDRGLLKYTFGYQLNDRKEFEEAGEYGLFLRLHTMNYDVAYRAELLAGWHMAAGINGMWQYSLNKGSEYLIPDYHLFDIGAYVSAVKQVGRWNLSAGVRADRRNIHSEGLVDDGEVRFSDFRRHFSALSGSLGTVWNVNRHLDIRANISRGFRAPNISELASNGVHEGSLRYEIGSSGLKPEYSLQGDIGMNYSNDWMSVQVALFLNRISNYIFIRRNAGTQIDGFDAFRYMQGEACLVGGEVSVDVHPIEHLHLSNSFGLVEARQLHVGSDERHLPMIPEPRWICDARYDLSAIRTTFKATLEQHFRQSQFYAVDATETATPAYTLLNIGAGWGWMLSKHTRMTVDLMLNNVFDRAYQNHLSRLKYTDINTASGRQGVFSMGRNLMVKIGIAL